MTDSAVHTDAAHGTAREVEILVNKQPVKVPAHTTGAAIKAKAGVPGDDQLFKVEGSKEIPVGDGERIEVRSRERFVATPAIEPA